MARVLIIGAGGVGQVVTHKCAAAPEVFDDIVLASLNKDKCDKIASQLKYPIKTAQVDADNVDAVVALCKRFNPQILINVALPYQDLTLMEACLQAGVHYVDTANYEPRDTAKFEYKWQWAYQERFRQAGLTALLGSGFDPGATNVFTTYLAKHYFDDIDQLDIVDINAGKHDYPFSTNFNPEINIREISAPCQHWAEGQFVTTPPMSCKQNFVCPESLGEFTVYRMYHEELESLSKHFPSLAKAQFWMSFSNDYLNHLQVLQNVGLTNIEPINFQGQSIVPIQFLKALLPDPATLGPQTYGKTCIGCLVAGHKDGQRKKVFIYNISDHQQCYRDVQSQAISYTAGVPAMIGAKMVVENKWQRPGVWNVEQFNPDPFMDDLNKYGLPWKVVEAPSFGFQA